MLDTIFAFVESILGSAGVEMPAMDIVTKVFDFILGLIGA